MKNYLISVTESVFNQFPGYVRGIVVGHNLKNQPSPNYLIALMRKAESDLRDRLSIEHLTEDPQIQAWREAFRAFGAKPGEFRSSIEAMARRVLRKDPIPSVNSLVDIGNIISLRYLVPVGCHAIDHLKDDLVLQHASGEETFNPFGTDLFEHPIMGEVVFCEGNTVLTRRWTWRQANQTLTLPTTTDVEFNVDGLPQTSPQEVENACKDISELTLHYCGGYISSGILSSTNPQLNLFDG